MNKAEEIINKIKYGKFDPEGWKSLQAEVVEFLKSDAKEKDKKLVKGYTEMLSIICNGY